MAGYTRQSVADIVTGADILAAPLNAEFNALQAAFHATTGHTHNGAAGNGPQITLTTSVSGILPIANGGTAASTAAAARTSLFGVSTTVDNTIPRFDGVTGSLQTSGIVVSDTDTVTGVTSLTISGATPVLFLTDTDTGADSFFSASSTTGSLLISADNGNEVANSDIVFRVDSSAILTLNTTSLTMVGTMAATTFSGSGASLTALNASNLSSGTVPDARFPATLPAASGVNLTALNASNLSSGTVPDARFPATLPAISGANLTNLDATDLTGTIASARISGSYTGITGTGTLAAGSITTTFGNINVGSSTVTGGAASFTSMASSGQVTGTTAIFSSTVTGTVFTAAAATNTIIASPTTNMLFRPNSAGSSTGQIVLTPSGDVTINGTLTITG